MRHAMVGIAVMALTACSSIQPVEIRSGATCFRCRRPIENTKLAAEIIDESRHVYTFRTAGCLAKYLTEHIENPLAVFVTDTTTGKLIKAQTALFVKATIDPRTNERDFVAFRDVKAAVAFANDNLTTPVDWMSVMAQTGAAKGN